jgi:AcrR family transcriptional regulator
VKTGGRVRRARREAILDLAVDLASAEGLEGLTIGRLAAELGMSKSGLFGRFGSKEKLQLAAVDTASQRFVSEVVEPARGEPEGLPRLRGYCDLYLSRQVVSGGCFWAGVAAEFDDRPGAVRDAIGERVAAWHAEIAHQAELGGVEDPDQLAFEIYSLTQGANSLLRLHGDKRGCARARAAIERLLS